MHDIFNRILFYGESVFRTETFKSRIVSEVSDYSISIKDGSFNMEESLLKPFELIVLECSDECDHLNTFFKLFPSIPIIIIIPQGSEKLLNNALKYPIANYVIADFEGRYIELLQPLFHSTLNKTRKRNILSEHQLAAEINQNLENEQSQIDFKQIYSLLRTMTDTVPDMIWAKDLQNRFIFTNASVCKNLLNASSTLEPLNKPIEYFIKRERAAHPEEPNWFTYGDNCIESDQDILKHRGLKRFKEEGNVFGKNLILDIYKAPIHDENGEIAGTVGSARDITDHEETKERYRKLFEFSPDPVVVHIDGMIIAANKAAADFIGADQREDYYGRNVFDFVHPDYRRQSLERIQKAKHNERHNKMVEEKYVTLDGTVRDVEAISVPISYGNQQAWMATFRDITERKQIAEEVQRSLREKNVLLNEIHHRTRNNMQVISSIINIRSRDISDNATKQMFKEITDRIRAMSLVHDRLYESHDLSAINFTAYLQQLSTHLSFSYSDVSSRVPIDIIAKPITVSIDYAVPLGLVINEILTNAYKYAFPDGRKGSVQLSLKRDNANGLKVSITDDGIGLPIDAFNDSLSTIILTTLVEEQLGGKLEYEIGHGTQFTIHVPEVEVKSRI